MHGLGIIIGKIPKNGNVEPVYNLIFPSSYSVINDASPGILYLYTLYCLAIVYISCVVKNVFQLISHFVPGSFKPNINCDPNLLPRFIFQLRENLKMIIYLVLHLRN